MLFLTHIHNNSSKNNNNKRTTKCRTQTDWETELGRRWRQGNNKQTNKKSKPNDKKKIDAANAEENKRKTKMKRIIKKRKN